MPVPETIQQLRAARAARAAHKAWVVRAEALIAGLPLDKKQVPVVATDCGFGKWYYGSGSRLQGFSVFNDLEVAHNGLHETYSQIFKLLFEDSASGLAKLFGQSKKHKIENQKKAAFLLPELRGHYDAIMTHLDTLEKDYLKMKNEEKVIDNPMEKLQTSSFRDVSKMMEELEHDVESWLK